jgi:peptide/nickel transport system substrate-binding protein
MRLAAPAAAALVATAAVGLGGCGGQQGAGVVANSGGARPGEGGSIAFALASSPRGIDPLLARDRPSQLLTRQIHEPLVETVSGPFGDLRQVPGLAQAYRPSGDRTIWRFELRRRVRFQDGEPFNASAVLANAARWQQLPEGLALLPDLTAVDAPRPELVRFILDRPDPDFPRRLSAPQLGMVSPQALPPVSDPRGRLRHEQNTGTGPFELRLLERDQALLVRNVDWWGSRLQLGPALDQVEFPVIRGQDERVGALEEGQVQAADEIGRDAVHALGAQPLLTYQRAGGQPYIGLERSVRGIGASGGVPLLSGAWLTTVGAASGR